MFTDMKGKCLIVLFFIGLLVLDAEATWFKKAFKKAKSFIKKTGSTIKKTATDIGNTASNLAKNALDKAKNMGEKAKDGLNAAGTSIKDTVNKIIPKNLPIVG